MLQEWARQPLTAGFLIVVAQAGAWALWALLATAVVARVFAWITRKLRWLPTPHLPGPLQGLTAALLGAAAVSASTGAAPAHAAAVADTGVNTDMRATHLARPHDEATVLAAVADSTAPPESRPAAGRHHTCTVKHGDTLSKIAERRLGDAHRWPEIFALNRGTHFDSGGTLTNPNLIYPGWTLDLPDDAHPPGDRKPAPAVPGPTQHDASPVPPASPTPSTATSSRPGTPPPTAQAATAVPANDGVAGPAPARATNRGSDSSTSAASATASPGAVGSGPTGKRGCPPGVSLLSDSWIDLGLALAIAAAAALVWAHRRRRYIPRPPSGHLRLDDPDLTPMPRIVDQVRRGLRRPAPELSATEEEHLDDNDMMVDGDSDAVTDVEDAAAVDIAVVADDEVESAEATTRSVDHAPQMRAPVVPAMINLLLVVWPPAGLGLTGLGAEAAARGFLTAGLAAGGLDDPNARTWVVMPSATAATLLGAAAVGLPATPRLTVTSSLDEALELLETQTLHRTRLVYQHDVDDVAGLRAADPFEEPLPPIMLLADTTTRRQRTRVAALLSQGRRLDIHGVLLGAWPDGNTVVVAVDGTTIPADGDTARHGRHPADIGRLAVLDPAETADLLKTLAESHTGQPQPPAPSKTGFPAGQENPDHARDTLPAVTDPPPATTSDVTAAASEPEATAEPVTDVHRDTPPTLATAQPSPIPPAEAASAGTGPDPRTADPGHKQPSPSKPVAVTVLGTPGIVDADPQRSPRAKSLELLVYLAVHDGDASTEAILDDLLPDAPASKAVHRLYTYVSDLRAVLRHNGGPGSYVTHPNQRYVLNHKTIDIDLWRMRAAIHDADTATTPPARIAALRRALDTHRGPLANGCDYEWIEPYREGVRRQVLDASLALAAELAEPTEQLTVLEAAISHNPYAEPLYQAVMRARAQLGHLDAIRTLRRTLTRRLAEIDTEPSDDSIALANELVAHLRQTGSDAPLRRAPAPENGAAA